MNAPGMVSITEGEHKGKFLKAKNILIATGCKMRRIPGLEYDGTRVMTSREALANTKLPKSVIIVGAGAIGVEFAYFYNALGSKVTLVEMLPQIVPVEDALHRVVTLAYPMPCAHRALRPCRFPLRALAALTCADGPGARRAPTAS